MKYCIPLLVCLALPLGQASAFAPSSPTAVVVVQGKKSKKKHKIKPSVQYATSWDAAVEEAKLLKVPLVVHLHGFT